MFLKFGKRKLDKVIINIDNITYFYDREFTYIGSGGIHQEKTKPIIYYDKPNSVELEEYNVSKIDFDTLKENIITNSTKEFVEFTLHNINATSEDITKVYVNKDKICQVRLNGSLTCIIFNMKSDLCVRESIEDVFDALNNTSL